MNEPNVVVRLGPTRQCGAARGAQRNRAVDTVPVGRQQAPTLTRASEAERGNPVQLSSAPRCRRVGAPRGDSGPPAEEPSCGETPPIAVRAWDVGRSEGRAIMVRIPVEISPGAKASPRPTGLPLRENLMNHNHFQERTQMTGVLVAPGALSASSEAGGYR